jgi:surface protein
MKSRATTSQNFSINNDNINAEILKYAIKKVQNIPQNPIGTWNVSQVTNMYQLFNKDFVDLGDLAPEFKKLPAAQKKQVKKFYENFNEDISGWNVSNVTNMANMFFRARKFNQPLNNWNVSNVTNMRGMFMLASDFNQPLNNWNVSNVTNMEKMFHGASDFNQPLNNWNVSNVNDMRSMFEEAASFNQPLNDWKLNTFITLKTVNSEMPDEMSDDESINSYNSYNDEDKPDNEFKMKNMFLDASDFNQNLTNWPIYKEAYLVPNENGEIEDIMFEGSDMTDENKPDKEALDIKLTKESGIAAAETGLIDDMVASVDQKVGKNRAIPAGVQSHILSFLAPKDVTKINPTTGQIKTIGQHSEDVASKYLSRPKDYSQFDMTKKTTGGKKRKTYRKHRKTIKHKRTRKYRRR